MIREGVFEAFLTPTWQIVLILVGLLLIGIGLLTYAWKTDRRKKEEARQRAQAQFQELARRVRLTPAEVATIDILSAYLANPLRKFVLLRNQSSFDHCTTLAVHEGRITADEIAPLRFKLEFVGPREGRHISSSTEIPEGAAVLIIKDIRPPERATVLPPDPTAFQVEMERPELAYAEDAQIAVIFNDDTGVYRFESTVSKHLGPILSIHHSEDLEQLQRREHFRREISLPVFVRFADSETKPVESRFVEIGGGGASITNRDNAFSRGDMLELSFHPGGDAAMKLVAEVMRTSQGISILHLRFTNIREESRNLLYSLLF